MFYFYFSRGVDDLEDLIDRSLDSLNGIWNSESTENQYPQSRMRHMFGCIGSNIAHNVQKSVSCLPLWESSSTGDVRLKLQFAIRLCDKWLAVPKQLTSTYWTAASHPWKGPPHEDAYVASFRNRYLFIHGNQVIVFTQ